MLGALAGVAWFLSWNAPGQSQWLPGCWFTGLTGILCPGCGVTRAAHALVHGQIATALSMNALMPIAGLAGAMAWLDEGLGRREGWKRAMDMVRDARVWAVLVIGFMVLRNLPWAPFSWLAPG